MPSQEHCNDEHDVSQPNPNVVGNQPLVPVCNDDGVTGGEHFSDEGNPVQRHGSFDVSMDEESSSSQGEFGPAMPWEPSGIWWKDMLYFVGPGKSQKIYEPRSSEACI